jgi:TctA family transporter
MLNEYINLLAVPTQHFPGQLIPLVICGIYSVNFSIFQMEMLTTLQMMSFTKHHLSLHTYGFYR